MDRSTLREYQRLGRQIDKRDAAATAAGLPTRKTNQDETNERLREICRWLRFFGVDPLSWTHRQ